MLTRRSLLPIASSLPLLQSDPPPGGGNPPATPPADPKPPEPPKVEFTAEQQAKVNDIEARVRKDTEDRVRAALKAEADETKRKADADAQRKRDADAGEFDKVRQSLESERDTAKASLDAANAELETLRTYVTADIKAALKDLPKALLAFDPGDDAPIQARLDWLTKAKTSATELGGERQRGNGPDKKPGGNGFDLQAEITKARQRGNYRV